MKIELSQSDQLRVLKSEIAQQWGATTGRTCLANRNCLRQWRFRLSKIAHKRPRICQCRKTRYPTATKFRRQINSES